MRLTRIRLATAVAAIVVGGAGATAIAAANEDAHPASAAVVSEAPQVVQSVDDQLKGQLHVFREDGSARSAVAPPAALAKVFNETQLSGPSGSTANVALARRAITEAGEFYIVPGAGTVCQIGGGNMACGPSADLSTDPLGYQVISRTIDTPDGKWIVSGIAADTVKSIVAIDSQGNRTPVEINNNAYASFVSDDTVSFEAETTNLGVITSRFPHGIESR